MTATSVVRLIIEDGVDPAYGLAADEACTAHVGEQPTLRLYTYAPCALVGRFQTIDNELHLERCEALGLPVNRRPTGGGAIVMGPDQLGVAYVVRGDASAPRKARAMMVRFSEALIAGLAKLGVRAEFRGKNDLEVGGRKLAGLGVYRSKTGGVLFHASVLVGLDVRHMLTVLSTPFEKITDKTIETVSGRVTTVRRLVDREVSIDEVRDAIALGFAETLEQPVVHGDFTDAERAAIRDLESTRYTDPGWIHQHIAVPDSFGTHRVKTPGGLLEVRATLAGTTLKAVYIGGDFFAEEGALADLEGRLRWHPGDVGALQNTIDEVCARWPEGLADLPARTLLEAVLGAARAASTTDAQYGCFVNPGGERKAADGS